MPPDPLAYLSALNGRTSLKYRLEGTRILFSGVPPHQNSHTVQSAYCKSSSQVTTHKAWSLVWLILVYHNLFPFRGVLWSVQEEEENQEVQWWWRKVHGERHAFSLWHSQAPQNEVSLIACIWMYLQAIVFCWVNQLTYGGGGGVICAKPGLRRGWVTAS